MILYTFFVYNTTKIVVVKSKLLNKNDIGSILYRRGGRVDINVLVILNLFMLVIPIAIIVFIVKSLANQRKVKEEIAKLNLKVEKLSEKLKSE